MPRASRSGGASGSGQSAAASESTWARDQAVELLNGAKLATSAPGIKLFSGPTTWAGKKAQVVSVDGKFDKLSQVRTMISSLNHAMRAPPCFTGGRVDRCASRFNWCGSG